MFNPYQQYQTFQQNQNYLPAQQIIQANGRASIDALRMAPNSSVLIADATAPIVWKCVSDGIGNVTAEPFDISPHKEAPPVDNVSLLAIVTELNDRLTRLEERYGSKSITREHDEHDESVKTNGRNAQTESSANHKQFNDE